MWQPLEHRDGRSVLVIAGLGRRATGAFKPTTERADDAFMPTGSRLGLGQVLQHLCRRRTSVVALLQRHLRYSWSEVAGCEKFARRSPVTVTADATRRVERA